MLFKANGEENKKLAVKMLMEQLRLPTRMSSVL